MKDKKKLLTFLVYGAFFWACFWMFAYWTFPYDRVAAYVTDRVAKSGGGYDVSIGKLSPYWFTGVELSNVAIEKRHSESDTAAAPSDAKSAAARAVHVRELRARVAVLPLLFGGRSVSFDAELEQGELSGSYAESGDERHVRGSLDKVDVGKLGVLDSVLTLPVRGDVSGEFDLTVGKLPANTNGTLMLTIAGLTIGDGKAKQKIPGMGGLTVDPVEVGNVRVELDVRGGLGTIKSMRSDGKDLELSGSGDVRFGEPLGRSRLNLLLRVRFTDNYRNKSARTRAMFAMLDGASEVAPAKTPDGALQVRLTGTVATLRAIPQGSAKAPSAGGNQAGGVSEANQ